MRELRREREGQFKREWEGERDNIEKWESGMTGRLSMTKSNGGVSEGGREKE